MATSLGKEIIEAFRESGIPTTGVHALQFYLYLPSESDAQAVAEQLSGDAFHCDVSLSADGVRWLCFARKSVTVDADSLNALGAQLVAACDCREGEFDGWDLDQTAGSDRAADVLLEYAFGLYQQGAYLRAAELLKRVGESGSDKAAIAWTLVGLACVHLEHFDSAVAAFDHVLAIEPNDAEALAGKAGALSMGAHHAEAVEYYERAIAVKPETAETHLNFAATLAALGRTDEAIAALKDAVTRDDRMSARARKMKAFASLRKAPGFDEAIGGKRGGLLGWLRP
jgi:tetratricopeptide (TPR) repeat protein